MATIQSAYPDIVTDTITGFAPLTVHLNPQSASSGSNYEWDFGDTGRINASGEDDLRLDDANDLWKTTGREPILPYGSKDVTTTTLYERDIDYNTDQRGAAAAYTYYQPGTYTVTLTEKTSPSATPVVTQITVVVEDAAPALFPAANVTTDWTRININTDGEAAGTDFANAIAAANARGGKMVIQFGSSTNWIKVDSGLTIDCSDLVIKGAEDIRPTFTTTLDNGNPRDLVDLLTITETSQNIYIEGIRFRPYDSEGQSGGLNANSYDPSSHTSIRGIVGATDAGTSARGIALQACDFWNFTTGVYMNGGKAFYACNTTTNRHNEAHMELDMGNVVISGSICGTSVQTPPTQTIQNDNTTTPRYIYEIGSSSRFSDYFAVQFCWLNYRGAANSETFTDAYPAASTYSGGDSGSFSGPLLLTQARRGTVYRNSFQRGTSTLAHDCSNIKVARNLLQTGGMSAAFEMGTGLTSLNMYSNVFELFSGRAQSYAIARRATTGSEVIDDIRIYNNTFILSRDISKNGGVIYTRANGTLAGQDSIRIRNNIFLDNHSFQAKVYDTQGSSVEVISDNVYFDDRPGVDFGSVNGVVYDYDQWKTNVEATAGLERIEHRFIKRYWAFTPDPNKHSSLGSGASSADNLVYEDFMGSPYTTSWGYGATKIDSGNYSIGSTNAFDISIDITDRADRLASGELDFEGNPISSNPGDNAVITIRDPDRGNYTLTRDFQRSLFQTSSGQPWEQIGVYIRTDIENVVINDDTIIFDLTYTNDGPSGQALPSRDGFTTAYLALSPQEQIDYADYEVYFNYDLGDTPKMALGSISVITPNLGDRFALLQQYRGEGFSDIEANAGNIFNLSNRTYPGTKYSSTTMMLNHEYCICDSLMWDIENEENSFSYFDLVASTGSSKGAISCIHSWRDEFSVRNPVTGSTSNGVSGYWLEEGESFSMKIAVKVTRNSRYEHVQTASPYKDFFQATYGPVNKLGYTKDPRPIQGLTLQQSFALSFPKNVYGYATGDRPDRNGWTGVRSRILGYETGLGMERTIMWPPGGNYLINKSGNFPFLMWTPFYDEGERNVGEFAPNSPVPPNLDPEDLDDDYPNGTFDPYPIQEMFDELPLMQDLNFEYPNMGYYWGRATQITFSWDTPEARFYDESDPVGRARFLREFDFMADLFRGRQVGMDAYRTSTYGFLERSRVVNSLTRRRYGGTPSQELRLMRAMRQRWPHCKIGTELALNDVYHKLGTVFYFNDGSPLTESHFMADYINPGHEAWSAFRFDLKTRYWGGRFDQTNDQRRYMMKQIAELGWVVLNFSAVPMEATGYTKDDFLAADRRFDFEPQPTDGAVPSRPGRFAYLVSRREPLFDSNYIRLRWDANQENDIRFYKVQKARVVNGIPDTNDFMTIDYTTENRFLDIASRDNESYIYRIIAVDFDGNESDPSEFAVQRIPDDPTLRPPVPIRATPQFQNGSIRLDWVDEQ